MLLYWYYLEHTYYQIPKVWKPFFCEGFNLSRSSIVGDRYRWTQSRSGLDADIDVHQAGYSSLYSVALAKRILLLVPFFIPCLLPCTPSTHEASSPGYPSWDGSIELKHLHEQQLLGEDLLGNLALLCNLQSLCRL